MAAFAEVEPEALGEVLVQEYGRCTMKLRPCGATGRGSSVDVTLEPRSAYLLSGPARTQWQHHIPAAESLRYSVTFRTLRKRQGERPRNLRKT